MVIPLIPWAAWSRSLSRPEIFDSLDTMIAGDGIAVKLWLIILGK